MRRPLAFMRRPWGYTQVPNHVLVSDRLSPGAKLTYAMLLKYAWQNDYCFPGQERLAKDMGVTDRSVRTYLQELEREQFITIKQRGLGKPNLYELNLSASAADRKKFPVRTGKNRRLDRKYFPSNKTHLITLRTKIHSILLGLKRQRNHIAHEHQNHPRARRERYRGRPRVPVPVSARGRQRLPRDLCRAAAAAGTRRGARQCPRGN